MTPGKKKVATKRAKRKHPHPGSATLKATLNAAAAAAVDAPPSSASLRWRAGVYYTTDLNLCTTADMIEMPEFATSSLDQLQKWAVLDGWTSDRKAFLERVQKKIELAITDKVVQRRLELLDKIRPVLDVAVGTFTPHDYIYGDVDEKKTWKDRCAVCGRPKIGHDNPFYGEAGSQRVNAIAKLIDIDLALSESVVQTIAIAGTARNAEGNPQNGSHGDHPPLSSSLTAEEARIAAHAVIRQRRAKTLGPAPDDDVDGGDDADADAADGSSGPG